MSDWYRKLLEKFEKIEKSIIDEAQDLEKKQRNKIKIDIDFPKKSFNELDKIQLIKTIKVDNILLKKGRTGTIVWCFPNDDYDIEFPDISDTFVINGKFLRKI